MNAVPGSGRLRADFSGRVVLVTGAAQGIGAASSDESSAGMETRPVARAIIISA